MSAGSLSSSEGLPVPLNPSPFSFHNVKPNERMQGCKVQCHGQTGYCWCSTPDGVPVNGSFVLHLRPNCTGSEHERASLLADVSRQWSEKRFVPECSADGWYKPVVRMDSVRPVPGTFVRNQLPDCSHQETHAVTNISVRTREEPPHVSTSPPTVSHSVNQNHAPPPSLAHFPHSIF